MKTTKNIKDIESKMMMKVHNIGAGGVGRYGGKSLSKMSAKRFSQEMKRIRKLNILEVVLEQ